jgi:hypothetical protein
MKPVATTGSSMDSAILTIGHLAKMTGTNVETVRFYEKAGLLPEPQRTAGRPATIGRTMSPTSIA